MRWFCFAVMCVVVGSARAAERPNVLFVVFDDLNDWVGCLGGHPQSQTPHIDRLAARGMLFTNAHCNASLCNPSRASALTGTLPSTNGVHGNQQDWRLSPFLKDHPTLPQYFREHEYWTAAGGKTYHANHGGECSALNGGHGGLRGLNHPASWTERFPNHDRQIPKLPVPTGRNFNGLDIWHWDWGPIDVTDSAIEDGQVSDWAVRVLKRLPSKASSGDSRTDVTSTGTQIDTPFFLAVGLYATHGPWYCPPAYFALHPIEDIELPRGLVESLERFGEEISCLRGAERSDSAGGEVQDSGQGSCRSGGEGFAGMIGDDRFHRIPDHQRQVVVACILGVLKEFLHATSPDLERSALHGGRDI